MRPILIPLIAAALLLPILPPEAPAGLVCKEDTTFYNFLVGRRNRDGAWVGEAHITPTCNQVRSGPRDNCVFTRKTRVRVFSEITGLWTDIDVTQMADVKMRCGDRIPLIKTQTIFVNPCGNDGSDIQITIRVEDGPYGGRTKSKSFDCHTFLPQK